MYFLYHTCHNIKTYDIKKGFRMHSESVQNQILCQGWKSLVIATIFTAVSAGWTEKWPKDPIYAIIVKSWVFKDVKYDIPMCQYHSTWPQPIQVVPTKQKKLFTLSFQPKFLRISFTKVTVTSRKSYVAAIFFLSPGRAH